METNDTTANGTAGLTAEPALIAAVEQLAVLEGMSPRPELMWHALRRLGTETSPTHQLARLAESAGLAVRPASPQAQHRDLLASGSPLIRTLPNGGWRIIRIRRGLKTGQAECWDFPTAPLATLRALSEVEDGLPPAPWFTVDPAAPGGAMLVPPDQPEGSTPVRRVLRLAGFVRADVGAVFIYSLARGLLTLAIPLTVQILINTVAFGSLRQPLLLLSLLLLLCLGLAALLGALQRAVIENIQQRVFTQLVADLAWRLPRVKYPVFDTRHGPELLNRFFDVLNVQKASAALLLQATDAGLQAGVGLVLLAFYHPWLAAFDLVLLLGLAVVWGLLGHGAASTAIRESYAKYAVAGWLQDVAANSNLFKTQGGPALAIERADALTREYLSARRAHFVAYMQQFVGTLALQGVAGATLLGVGGMLVLNGELSLGQLVAAEFVVTTVLAALVKFADKLETWYDLLASVDKLGGLVELPTERIDGLEPRHTTAGVSVEVRGLGFRFDRPVLHAIDLKLDPGARAIIEGPAGAGKSTLAELLLGFRDAAGGTIAYDGDDLRDLRLGAIREHALLLRGTQVLRGTVADNVAWEERRVDRRVIKDALARVGLLDAVVALPKGLDTPLTPAGSPLTDGQLRRLQIARALVATPRLLLIDHLVDGLSGAEARALLAPLLDEHNGCTLILFTRDSLVLPGFQRFRLHEGKIQPTTEVKRG